MSAVHKYYRKISENVDNIKNSIDIASLLIKSQEVDSKLEVNETNVSDNLKLINTNKSNISDILELINTNKSNISDNLELINTNKSNISDNLELINTNKSIISDNLSLINTNKSNISDNLELINTNVSDISTLKTNVSNNYNFTQINKKKSENNTTFIDTNRNNIENNSNTLSNIDTDLSNLRGRTNTHQDDIQKLNEKVYYLSDFYKLKDIIIVDIIKSTIAETVDSNNEFVIINSSLNNLKKDSYLAFDSSILIFFHKHYISIGFFHILLEYFNDKNVLFESIKMPIKGMVSKHCIITNSCIIKLPNDLDKIYYKLSIKLNDNQNRSDNISILDFDNKIYFKYYEKIN